MRIHTDHLSVMHVIHALQAEHQAGRIAFDTRFRETPTRHASRARAKGIEILLTCSEKVPGDGRRAGNTGAYGSMDASRDGYAATYDEWGWLLGALYAEDPDMIVGASGSPVYADRGDFDHRTGLTYNPRRLLLEMLAWPTFADVRDPYPYLKGFRAGKAGRRGSGRLSEAEGAQWERRGWPVRHAPRTVADVQAFAHLSDADVAAIAAEAVRA